MPEISLSTTLRAIRDRLGITAKEMASATEISEGMIRKLEYGEHTRLRGTTANRFIRGLETLGVPAADVATVARLMGISVPAAIVTAAAHGFHSDFRRMLASVPATERECFNLVLDLLDEAEPEQIEDGLRAMLSIAKSAHARGLSRATSSPRSAATSKPRTFRVTNPPIRRPDGAVEQTFVDYEEAPQTPPAATEPRASKPKRGTA